MKHENFDALSLTELIRLQNELSEIVVRRFKTTLALLFSDIVKSTEYFGRFGNEAGRKLQQRHFDLLDQIVRQRGGRIVDTAGDGGFSCFATAEQAAEAAVQLQLALCKENIHREREHQLLVRIGIHYGTVLTDNVLVAGDAVNLCARVAASGEGAEIRLTREAFAELAGARRVCCRALAPINLRGIARPVPTLVLEWRDPKLFPAAFRIEETSRMSGPYRVKTSSASAACRKTTTCRQTMSSSPTQIRAKTSVSVAGSLSSGEMRKGFFCAKYPTEALQKSTAKQ